MKKILLLFSLLAFTFPIFAQQSQDEKLAIQYFQNGEFEKAAELFEDIFNKKQDTYIYYYYYQTLISLDDFKKLEKLVKKQQRAQPDAQRYKVDLGYVYERAGQADKAAKVYEDAIKDLPTVQNKIIELYNAFLTRNLRDYSIKTLKRGRELLKNEKLFSLELTNIYTQLQLTDQIIDEALSLVKDNDPTYLKDAESILQNLLIEDEEDLNYNKVKIQLQKFSQKDPDNTSYVSLLYWIYQIRKDYQGALVLAKSLDKRYKEDGERLYFLAKLAAQNRDYDVAIDALQYVLAKGSDAEYYTKSRQSLLEVKFIKLTSSYPVILTDAQKLELEFKKAIDEYGIHSGTSDWVRKYAYLLAFYVNKQDEAMRLLNEAIATVDRDPKEKALYKVDLADIQLYTNDVWEATLNYSQVEKDFPNDTIGHFAKFKNAKLSFYIGEFSWAKSQLDVLRAATSKLIANDAMYFSLLISDNEDDVLDEDVEEEEDSVAVSLFQNEMSNRALRYFAKADFMIFKNQDDQAMILLDSVIMIDPFGKLADDVYFQKAKLLLKKGDYFGAENFLKQIVEKFAYELLADDAIFQLGELYEFYLKDNQKAMDYYQTLMRDYSDSLYAVEARKRFRALRGDI